MIRSKYKHLVVSGCSFTTNEHVPNKSDWAWPNTLAKDTGMTIHNLATAGAGNSHISQSLITYLERENLPPQETLVLAMWSGVGRIDFTVSAELSSQREYQWNPWTYFYTPQCRLHQGRHWWHIKKPNDLDRAIISYAKFQDDYSLAFNSWFSMTVLASYLQSKNVKHYFTSFLNYRNNVIHSDAASPNLDHTLHQMGLEIDYSNWLDLDANDYYGDWCKARQLLVNDGFHPGADGPQRWPREVLIPALLKEGVLYDL